MKNKIFYIKNILNKVQNWKFFYPCIVFLFATAYISPLFFNYINGDDTVFHLQNIHLYSESSVFSKIFPSYANNLGWGVGIFYPSLPHVFCGVILRFISKFGFSAILAIKILKVLIVFLAGLLMYILSLKLYKSKKKAMFSSIFYLSSSYFLVDVYMRDALNESMLFVFVPLVFLSFFYLFEAKNKKMFYICFISGYVGMIYSHLLLTVFFTLILIPFLILYIKQIFSNGNFKCFLIGTPIVLGLVSTFIVPLAEHMIKDLWFIPAYKNVWVLPFRGYFISDYYKTSSNGLLFIYVSRIVLLLTVLGIYNLFFKKNEDYSKKFIGGILLISILSMVLTSLTIFWEMAPSFFKNIQFAWRLTIFSTFGLSLVATSGLDNIYNLFKEKYKYIMTISLLVCLSVFTYNNLSKVKFCDEVSYPLNYNIESGVKDYFPKSTLDNLGYVKKIKSDTINTLSGNANIKILDNSVPNMKFEVSNIEDEITIELPRLYYLGYVITDADGNKINYTEDKSGLIKLHIKHNGTYTVKYTGTNAYKISILLKIITIVFSVFILLNWWKNKIKNVESK